MSRFGECSNPEMLTASSRIMPTAGVCGSGSIAHATFQNEKSKVKGGDRARDHAYDARRVSSKEGAG